MRPFTLCHVVVQFSRLKTRLTKCKEGNALIPSGKGQKWHEWLGALLGILICCCLILRFLKDFAVGNLRHEALDLQEFYLLEDTWFFFFFIYFWIHFFFSLQLFSNRGIFHFWNYRKTFLTLAKETRAGWFMTRRLKRAKYGRLV